LSGAGRVFYGAPAAADSHEAGARPPEVDMEKPRWFDQLVWSGAHAIRDLDASIIPPGAGLYAFTTDAAALTARNALYVGKADGARQTLRTRIGAYLRRFAAYPAGRPSRHHGMEQLARYHREHAGMLYVRWTGVVVARDLEGSLIHLFDPRFNGKDEHRLGFADEELIPDALLYTWP
jgi:hypothetical protein